MNRIELLIDMFAFCLCGWGIYGLYVSIRIERFIVKRYELETDILDTVFFKEHATFTRQIPNLFSSAMYTSRLLMLLWGWRIFKGRKMYRNIKDTASIIKHFSKKEIRLVKCFAISACIVAVHGVIYYILKFFWPEVLN